MEGWEGAALLEQLERVAKKRRVDAESRRIEEVIALLAGWLEREPHPAQPPGEGHEAERWEAHDSLAGLADLLEAQDPRPAIQEHHKELSGLVAKLGKLIDKTIPPRLDHSLPNLNLEPHLIDQAVYVHLLYVGLFDVAELFHEEAQLGRLSGHWGSSELAAHLRALHDAKSALRQRQVAPALKWVERHRAKLSDRGATSRFLLHRLQAACIEPRSPIARRASP